MSWRNNYYRAIVVTYHLDATEFKKYSTIAKTREAAFIDFVKKKFPEADHINFYTKENDPFTKKGKFVKQVKL